MSYDFETQLAGYVAGVQAKMNTYAGDLHATPDQVELERGPRYIRVVIVSGSRLNPVSRSVHSFIDSTNGDILKPKGWKGPGRTSSLKGFTNGARGTIMEDDCGLKYVSHFGVHYLR